ncbi:MAG: DUF2660 domain-containing protein [Pseudomonadota bacterium]
MSIPKEELKQIAEEKSWDFLDDITNKVSPLSKETQEQIKDNGKILNAAGVIYIHVIDLKQIKRELDGIDKQTSQERGL